MDIRKLILITSLGLSISVGAQESAKGPVKLKDSVALGLHTTREQYLSVQVQVMQLQQQMAQLQNEYQAQLKTALKDSGIDDTKYDLDPNTLNVKEKPSDPQNKQGVQSGEREGQKPGRPVQK